MSGKSLQKISTSDTDSIEIRSLFYFSGDKKFYIYKLNKLIIKKFLNIFY